jgi:hypothetical protein
MKHFKAILPRFLVAGALAVSLASIAGVASAASGPAYPGALNMLHAWGAGPNWDGLGGMAHAMSVNNPKGDHGMWCAVANSGTPNPYCP